MTDVSPEEEKERLANAILSSEAMIWLMCGGDPQWVESHVRTIRPAWRRWRVLHLRAGNKETYK